MESGANQHVEEERLEAYAMNLLAAEELVRVEEHLLFCEACLDRMQAVDRHVRAMENAALRVRNEERQARGAPAISQALARLRALLYVPIPIWFGVIAMVVLLIMVTAPFGSHPGPPVDVELQAVRGESTGTALAGHALRLRLDNQGVQYLHSWRIEIVDSGGGRVWTGTGSWSDAAVNAVVPKSFTPGTYYVRLLNGAQDPVREYQLVVVRPPGSVQ